MENSKTKFSVETIVAILVFIGILIMIFMKASEVKKENASPRQGTSTSVSN
jgi:hypothetical protein